MRLVISAVNFTEGGPLTVLRDAVKNAAQYYPNWEIIVLVNRIGILSEYDVIELEFPKAKKSWIYRLWLEWWSFKSLSVRLKPDVWLSLHDITPRVLAARQYVYCHNPAPFCREKIPFAILEKNFLLFKFFYGILYGVFIKRNNAVIVQQEWLRKIFLERFSLRRVIVAHPQRPRLSLGSRARINSLPKTFFYPAFPRVFKNFELLGDAIEILEGNYQWRGEILITIDGTENLYAEKIYHRYRHLKSLKFIGLQSALQMDEYYSTVDALIFPSLLETWGLPLSEARDNGLPILVADLPYARETVGSYDKVILFEPHSPRALALLILDLHLGRQKFGAISGSAIDNPYADSWKELFDLLLIQDELAKNEIS